VDTRQYIDSGILEAYFLGSLSAEEEALVEANIARYPELAEELHNIENALLQLSSNLATEPPAGMQDKIWDAIQRSGANTGAETTAPYITKTIPFQPEYRKPAQWKYAAIWVALIGSAAVNIILYSRNSNDKAAQVAMNAQMDSLKAGQQQYARLLSEYQKSKTMMADTGTQTIVMHTMQPGHAMAATLYWSKSNGNAYVSIDGLPQAPKGMQYQLWVIQGGKPVSMGVLPNDMANTPAMQKVAMQVTDGQAFAISLEKEGGNPTPTTVYVLGKA
jgi:anti-sigma-K factor RskA